MAIFKRRAADPADAVAAVPSGRQPISLALQGGGAHGAFQWGVLDRLLEVDRLDIRAVSGVSAGAMNGAALVSGLASGDARAAQLTLFLQRPAGGHDHAAGATETAPATETATEPEEWKLNPSGH